MKKIDKTLRKPLLGLRIVLLIFVLLQASFLRSIAQNTYTLPTASCESSCWAYRSDGTTKITFMCYNLGAEDSDLDPFSYNDGDINGDYYQWGRPKDGHEQNNSATTSALATNTTATAPAAIVGNFSLGTTGFKDWISGGGIVGGIATDRWKDAAKASNDPCPVGYRVPSSTTWFDIYQGNTKTWTGDGYKIGTNLYLPANGSRSNAGFKDVGIKGYYWSSTWQGNTPLTLYFDSSGGGNLLTGFPTWAYVGAGVRCVAE